MSSFPEPFPPLKSEMEKWVRYIEAQTLFIRILNDEAEVGG